MLRFDDDKDKDTGNGEDDGGKQDSNNTDDNDGSLKDTFVKGSRDDKKKQESSED